MLCDLSGRAYGSKAVVIRGRLRRTMKLAGDPLGGMGPRVGPPPNKPTRERTPAQGTHGMAPTEPVGV
jgi:hypothetical protein